MLLIKTTVGVKFTGFSSEMLKYDWKELFNHIWLFFHCNLEQKGQNWNWGTCKACDRINLVLVWILFKLQMRESCVHKSWRLKPRMCLSKAPYLRVQGKQVKTSKAWTLCRNCNQNHNRNISQRLYKTCREIWATYDETHLIQSSLQLLRVLFFPCVWIPPAPLGHCPTVTMETQKWVNTGQTSLWAISQIIDV